MYLNKLTIVCCLLLSPLFVTAAFEEPDPGTSLFKTGHQTWRLEDKTRRVDPYNNNAGSDTRLLVTEIWYPSDDVNGTVLGKNAPVTRSPGPFPLIIYSHGILSERMECAYLGRYLAERGVIVVSFTAPGTSLYDVGNLNYEDIYKLPGDVSFLIDEMLRRNADENSPFYGKIDQSRIGAAGTSLGANVTLMTAFKSSLRDPRISLAVTFAGGIHEELEENMFDEPEADIPLLLVHGNIDPIVPYEENALVLLGSAPGTTYLLTLIGGTHTGFAHAAKLFFMANNADQIGCWVLAKTGILQCDSPLPEGMKPQRQHDLCAMAVWSFISMCFSDGAEERDGAADFFLNDMPSKYGDEIELQSNREWKMLRRGDALKNLSNYTFPSPLYCRTISLPFSMMYPTFLLLTPAFIFSGLFERYSRLLEFIVKTGTAYLQHSGSLSVIVVACFQCTYNHLFFSR